MINFVKLINNSDLIEKNEREILFKHRATGAFFHIFLDEKKIKYNVFSAVSKDGKTIYTYFNKTKEYPHYDFWEELINFLLEKKIISEEDII